MKRPSGKKQTAYHETGHAIAAKELGVMLDVISIVPGEGRLGGVGVEGDDFFSVPGDPFSAENEPKFQAWAETQAVIDYAGHAALVELLGIGDMSDKSGKEHGAWDDFAKASLRFGHDRRRMKKAKARAVEIVTGRRDDIEKVAAWLLKRKRLDSQQVDMVLGWGTPEGPFGRVMGDIA